MKLHLAADQGTIHSKQAQQMLDKLEQHQEHDREPAKQTVNDIASKMKIYREI